jgi:Sortase domain
MLAVGALLLSLSQGESARRAAAPPAPAATPTPATAPTDPGPGDGPTPPTVGRAPATVAPTAPLDPPVRVVVAGVEIAAAVMPVGVAADGQMELPADPAVLGWYRYGPAPGADRGSVVLAGHVDSRRYGVGPLARLRQSGVGDEVLVRTAAGVQVRYRVTDVQSVPKQRLALGELFRRDGPHELFLVTCGGDFDRSRGGYRDNVVVTAAPA